MAKKFLDSEDVPFAYDTDSFRLWRMEGDRLIEIEDAEMAFDIRMNSLEISYGRARVLAAGLASQRKRKIY